MTDETTAPPAMRDELRKRIADEIAMASGPEWYYEAADAALAVLNTWRWVAEANTQRERAEAAEDRERTMAEAYHDAENRVDAAEAKLADLRGEYATTRRHFTNYVEDTAGQGSMPILRRALAAEAKLAKVSAEIEADWPNALGRIRVIVDGDGG